MAPALHGDLGADGAGVNVTGLQRSVYVVVPVGHAAAAPVPEPATGMPKGSNDVGLSQDHWRAAMQNAPLLWAAAGAAVWCSTVTSAMGAVLVVWITGAALLSAACAVAGAAAGRNIGLPLAQRWRRLFSVLAIVLMLWLAGMAWLPTAGLSTPELQLLRQSAVAAVACSAAIVLTPSRPAVLLAAMLPWAHVLASLHAPLLQPGLPAVLLPSAGLYSLLAAALALSSKRMLASRVRWHVDCERRLAEAEAQRDAAVVADDDKTRLLSSASHDLRQPVHALGLFAATLQKRQHDRRDKELIGNIVRSVEGLERSLNAMLDISRLDAGSVEPNLQHFPLRDLFRRLQMQFAGQAESAKLSLRFSPGGKWVTSDPQLLERILGNLVQNALKYTVRGGVAVVARTTARHFNVEVWDTGVGISAAELPRIFDEYYQVCGHGNLRLQGLGMGLAIVKRLVRLLGHPLTVVSVPGRGTLFRLSIAQRGAPEVQDLIAPADTQPMPAGRPRSVLIVDDDESICIGLRGLLEESGFVALSAASLEQAQQILRVLELPPDLLVTDLHLGNGPNGLTVIDALRRQCAFNIPAILITGNTAFDDAQQMGGGAYPVLFKPVDPRKLLQTIRSLVG